VVFFFFFLSHVRILLLRFMESGSLSEDAEVDKESTAHVDDFKGGCWARLLFLWKKH
jgi:hypothetical protein